MTEDPRERVVVRPASEDPATVAAIVGHAVRRGFRRVALPAGVATPAALDRFELRSASIVSPDGVEVPRLGISSPAELEAALSRGAPGSALAIRWVGERVIPLENAIAARTPGAALWVEGVAPSQTPALLGALESGAELVFVDVGAPSDLDALEAVLDARPHSDVEWTPARVRAVRPAGLGDRVLVDTTSLLDASEGLAVGSTAEVLFLVLSEAEGSRYTRPRRFRVNAGGPHAYVRMADGTTRYLSELEPGEELLAVRVDGRARGVRVGRLKIERRPLVLVEAEAEGRRGTVFLQEAETVRLSGVERPVGVTELVEGASVRATLGARARHLGREVHESVEER